MDTLIVQMRNAFASHPRPKCVVIHPDGDCWDCPEVADALAECDCESILGSNALLFTRIPIDCMTGEAFLHYLPAIARQSLHPDGLGVAETVAWILGADEWDTELTISEQIRPKLGDEQYGLVQEFLTRLSQLPLSKHAGEQLAAAKDWWGRSTP